MRLRLLALMLLAAAPLRAAGPAVALLPLENLSAADAAPREIEQKLAAVLEAKGWSVVASKDLEAVLEKNRVRYVDSLDDDARTAVLQEANAVAYVSGSLYMYEEGRNPTVALSARMVRADGTVAWADVAGVAATDTERAFGFGRASSVADVANAAIAKLSAELPRAGSEAKLPRGDTKPRFRRGPSTYRAPELDPQTPNLVCVLPLENESMTSEASRIVAEILTIRLAAANGFEVVDPAKLRAAALKARIPTFRTASNDVLARLSPLVGTTLFLRGTVYGYTPSETVSDGGPYLQMEITLDDVSAARTVWTAQHERRGTDYAGLLMLGAVTNGVVLTDRVVTEMIDAQTGRVAERRTEAQRARLRASRENR